MGNPAYIPFYINTMDTGHLTCSIIRFELTPAHPWYSRPRNNPSKEDYWKWRSLSQMATFIFDPYRRKVTLMMLKAHKELLIRPAAKW
jgi:hypothetical protein